MQGISRRCQSERIRSIKEKILRKRERKMKKEGETEVGVEEERKVV